MAAATIAAGVGILATVGGGNSRRSVAACEEVEKADKNDKGEEAGTIHREDSRSAMWPNRDRPSKIRPWPRIVARLA